MSATAAPSAEQLFGLGNDALRELLLSGHPIFPDALAGWAYGGTSLGLPGWVDRLAWKTFVKVFSKEGHALRGWNIRIRQDDPQAFRPMLDRRGRPKGFGRFQVTALPPAGALALPVRQGLLLDYGRGGNGRLDPVRFLRDPLVALTPGDASVLLGCSLVSVGPARFTTPSYFVLQRLCPLEELDPGCASDPSR